ncbi:hypothetical protein L6452_14946 [Arctium lappa]|uniref:Uncharacterized protein n=1 Tax=Arctium lappa TaxID=4217 RepID=A0ACB9CMI1_ARCLA|nr:hypothetical protein L6452_14946 [Arctium lappa]
MQIVGFQDEYEAEKAGFGISFSHGSCPHCSLHRQTLYLLSVLPILLLMVNLLRFVGLQGLKLELLLSNFFRNFYLKF